MACEDELMEQEGSYLGALESATGYTIEGFTISIQYPGGTLLFYDKDVPRPQQ
jgi:heat shock protein HslJ